MMLLLLVALLAVQVQASTPEKQHDALRRDFLNNEQSLLDGKWGTDFGFSGISTFAHLPHERCLQNKDLEYDIAVVGVPFDTSVTYRTGARFGPKAIRASSARQTPFRSYNPRAGLNPYRDWAKILDCSDIPVTPFDNALALRQMTEGFTNLLSHAASKAAIPKVLALGGDHSIALPMMRSLSKIYGKVAVVHLDAHLDTWSPLKYPSFWLDANNPQEQSFLTHGTMFWLAHNESLMLEGRSVHAGLRTKLTGLEDYEDDDAQGWMRVTCDDVDDIGMPAMAKRIVEHVGHDTPVYLSVDIDVLDPGFAPGTGTPEPGGWSTRELIRLLRGIEALNIVAADVVEVAPSFDDHGEVTSLAAAQVAYEILTSMVKRGPDVVDSHTTGKDEL